LNKSTRKTIIYIIHSYRKYLSYIDRSDYMRFIDLRSDTVTLPTEKMRQAMFEAEVGDDVLEGDPTIKKLEAIAAEVVGKEAALFVPSGTMGNQVCIYTHTRRGDEIIVDSDCHIVTHEAGASAIISGVQLRTIKSEKGYLDVRDVEEVIRKEYNVHYPDTGLICLENARADGIVVQLDKMAEVYHAAKKYNIPIHLDGARIFNAALALKVDVKEITNYTDSVMFCLSKGLGAPVGSIIAGTRDFIHHAQKSRKLMGGGMRQAGVLAAAGIIALIEMRDRLSEDHENAQLLADGLSEIPGIKIDKPKVQINMVFVDITGTGINDSIMVEKMYEKGIKLLTGEGGSMRFVTNKEVSRDDVLYTIKCMKEVCAK
jgi:threonine aldolase